MKLIQTTILLLMPIFIFGQTALTPAGLEETDKFGRNVAIEGDRLLGSTNNFNELNKAYVYIKQGGAWVEDGLLQPDDLELYDEYGRDLDIYGDYAVVGAPSSNDEGRAYVFKRNGAGDWSMMQKLVSDDISNDHQFGLAVEIHENTILIGAGNAAASYIFTRSGDTWSQQAKLTGATAGSSRFGHYLSLHGDYAAIAAHQAEEVYIFKREGTTWTEMQKIDSPDGINNSFGVTLGIHGDRLLVGSLKDGEVANNAGAAYVFKRTGETWDLEQKLMASDGVEGQAFAGRVSFSGNYALIGTLYGVDFYNGSAYVFQRDGNSWTEIEKYETNLSDYFGWGTSVSGSTAVVAAYGSDVGVQTGGALYVYDLPVVNSVFDVAQATVVLSAFPNPMEGIFQLNLPTDTQIESMIIVDVNGKIVYTHKGNETDVNLSSHPAGIYFVEVRTNEGLGRARVVKK